MASLTFLVDVDNTLLDNDRLKTDLSSQIEGIIGSDNARRFWQIYEDVRRDDQYVDYPDTVDRFAEEHPSLPNDELRAAVMNVDFNSYLYPGAAEALDYFNKIGEAVVVSDGDPVYQREKIERSGIAERVGDRYVLTVHKQNELEGVFQLYPADHYAIVDDKSSIFVDVRHRYPAITTVLVLQGKYAHPDVEPRPDIVLPRIADATHVPKDRYLSGGAKAEYVHSE
jgi:hypothetical protein